MGLSCCLPAFNACKISLRTDIFHTSPPPSFLFLSITPSFSSPLCFFLQLCSVSKVSIRPGVGGQMTRDDSPFPLHLVLKEAQTTNGCPLFSRGGGAMCSSNLSIFLSPPSCFRCSICKLTLLLPHIPRPILSSSPFQLETSCSLVPPSPSSTTTTTTTETPLQNPRICAAARHTRPSIINSSWGSSSHPWSATSYPPPPPPRETVDD